MDERQNYNDNEYQHRLVVEDRNKTEISGVLHVDSFDDEEIILETELGLLAIRGESLHIKQLILEQGEMSIEGHILEMVYSEDKKMAGRGKSFLQRLFR